MNTLTIEVSEQQNSTLKIVGGFDTENQQHMQTTSKKGNIAHTEWMTEGNLEMMERRLLKNNNLTQYKEINRSQKRYG